LSDHAAISFNRTRRSSRYQQLRTASAAVCGLSESNWLRLSRSTGARSQPCASPKCELRLFFRLRSDLQRLIGDVERKCLFGSLYRDDCGLHTFYSIDDSGLYPEVWPPDFFSGVSDFVGAHTKLTLGAVLCSIQGQSILTGSKLHLREMQGAGSQPVSALPPNRAFVGSVGMSALCQ
jgi:hypothetical protein